MDKEIKNAIVKSVEEILIKFKNKSVIKKFENTHKKKSHFIPIRYRMFGGMLQSMNIQFGDFIEAMITNLIKREKDDSGNKPKYKILEDYSGIKKNNLYTLDANEKLIDGYISNCQNDSEWDCEKQFTILQKELIENVKKAKKEDFISVKHDVDILFKDIKNNVIYYVESKYNDDHDSDKFPSLNRKVIKTYSYLLKEFNITEQTQLVPILFYFTPKRSQGNIYIPESTNIKRGKQFFEAFLSVEYSELSDYLKKISEDKEVIKRFDNLYKSIVKKEEEE